jgi:hypothetical protein
VLPACFHFGQFLLLLWFHPWIGCLVEGPTAASRRNSKVIATVLFFFTNKQIQFVHDQSCEMLLNIESCHRMNLDDASQVKIVDFIVVEDRLQL